MLGTEPRPLNKPKICTLSLVYSPYPGKENLNAFISGNSFCFISVLKTTFFICHFIFYIMKILKFIKCKVKSFFPASLFVCFLFVLSGALPCVPGWQTPGHK